MSRQLNAIRDDSCIDTASDSKFTDYNWQDYDQKDGRYQFTRKQIQDAWRDPQPDEFYVIVTRGYPRFVGGTHNDPAEPFDAADTDLSPSWILMNQYGKVAPDQWHAAFVNEVGRKTIVNRALKHADAAGGRTTVFVCYEPDGDDCHTYTLLDVLADELSDVSVTTRADHNAALPGYTPTQRGLDEFANVCRNGQRGCDGPEGDDLPCFPCFQDATEEQRTTWPAGDGGDGE